MRGTTIELLWSHGIVCPLVRRSSRCTWGFYVAWTAGLHHKALFPHSTPELQSLFESHRQRRWLTHWSYRTIQRLFNTSLHWCQLNWLLIRHHLLDADDVVLMSGDHVVVTKSGKTTYGLDRFFSSLY